MASLQAVFVQKMRDRGDNPLEPFLALPRSDSAIAYADHSTDLHAWDADGDIEGAPHLVLGEFPGFVTRIPFLV